ncbi:MAG: S-layer homology domain-containing protein, partial [Vallitaleaceae bacterium]|nr:S-layer homology domain-containing protein [Vallitaleaceae bacterium]
MYRGIKNMMIGMLLFQSIGPLVVEGAIEEDQAIVSAEIANSYEGRDLATETLQNLNFTDVSESFWAKETITRMGALNVVKGYNAPSGRNFRPNGNISKEEALAFLLRAVGQEEEAQLAAEALEQGATEGVLSMWSKGYMSIAADLEMIEAQDLEDSLIEEQEFLDPEYSFIRGALVTREEVAKWVVQAINSQNPDAIVPLYSQQNIYNYTDWEQMGIEFIPYIEAVMEKQIMIGSDGRFKPKAYITRAEMMQVIKNLNTILYETMNLEVKNGYIGHIDRESTSLTSGSQSEIKALIRQGDGKVDQLIGRIEVDNLGRTFQKEAVVYKQNRLVTLQELEEGDTIEYIVNTVDNTVVYVYVKESDQAYTVSGVLQPFSRLDEGIISLQNDSQDLRNYVMADSIYHLQNGLVKINSSFVRISDVPVTNLVTLTLKNQVVTHIRYENEVLSATEISGLVIEHNPAFRYMRISDWNGNEVIKRYYEGTVTVEKQAYYDDENQVGYLDELYPYYGFDESDS